MIDYSETLLSINKSMQEVHKLLLAGNIEAAESYLKACLLYTSPSPRDRTRSRMPSSA